MLLGPTGAARDKGRGTLQRIPKRPLQGHDRALVSNQGECRVL